MNQLRRMFARPNEAAFMPYVCCGDPNEKFTVKLVKALVENGADAIEFGIPFSDPIADGKAIQAASQRALASGMTPRRAIASIAKLRKEGIDVPIVAMTYYNIVFANGERGFLAALKKAGADGLIVPDLPLEEAAKLRAECERAGILLVGMVAPNCSDLRLRRIAAGARGFLYAVSVFGTTGARNKVDAEAIALVRRVKRATSLPVCAGFGIALPSHAKEFAKAGADGIIVGSQIANLYSKAMSAGGKNNEQRTIAAISSYARRMKRACGRENG
ncbi:MAG: tryptophan synthase subunit alpha [Candidatus Anstonellaceae archaeon]